MRASSLVSISSFYVEQTTNRAFKVLKMVGLTVGGFLSQKFNDHCFYIIWWLLKEPFVFWR